MTVALLLANTVAAAREAGVLPAVGGSRAPGVGGSG